MPFIGTRHPGTGAKSHVAAFFAVLLGSTALAQAQIAPGLGYVFPPAIRAGQPTDVQLGGFDFTPDMQWFVHDARVRLEILGEPGEFHLPPPPYWIGPRAGSNAPPIPREVAGRIAADRDMPAGLVRWQVANANGSSATAVFYVSQGTEIVESRSRDLPQRLPALPVAVSGRLSRLTEVDRYELVVDRDGPVSIDLMARRLGSGLNGALQVHDSAGALLADFADTQGLDGGVTFAAKAGETYVIGMHDVDFRGDRAFVYRLAVRPGPRVVCTIPAAGQRGSTREVELVGLGVATGRPVWESVRQVVAFPADPALVSYSHVLQTPFGNVETVIPLSDEPELAREPSPGGDAPYALAAPAGITAVLPPQVGEQRYAWQVAKDETWALDVQSLAIGGRLDVALAVLDPDGRQVGENDDLPGLSDAGLEFRATASGQYTCIVRGLSSQVGAGNEVYRLHVRRRVPDFSLTVPQQIGLPAGGKVEVAIQAVRTGGFDGDIVVSVEGLPEGATPLGDWTIPAGTAELKAIVESNKDAAVAAAAIRFRGRAALAGAPASRQALAMAAGNLCPRTPAEQKIPQALLATTMAPPFDVQLVDRSRQREVHRGATCLPEFVLVRKNGFAGEIVLHMSSQQSRTRQGIRGPMLRVPSGVERAVYPCFMPEWLATDVTQRMTVQGVAAVPDPRGNLRFLTKPADANVTMIMQGALLKLSSLGQQPTVRPGESFEASVAVSRSVKLPVAAKIELVVPEELAGILQAEPLVLEPGQDRGVLRITSRADARLPGPWSLRLTATSVQDGQWPVISETEMPVVFAAP